MSNSIIPRHYSKHRLACWHCSRSLYRTRKGYVYVLVIGHDGHEHPVHVSCEDLVDNFDTLSIQYDVYGNVC